MRVLGVWDDVFVRADEDLIVLRRGEQLFSISMAASADPNKLVATRAAKKSQIVAAVSSGQILAVYAFKRWRSVRYRRIQRQLSRFDIPGLASTAGG